MSERVGDGERDEGGGGTAGTAAGAFKGALNDGRALDKRRATVRWERQLHVPTHSGAGAAVRPLLF